MNLAPEDRLIVALDTANVERAQDLVNILGDTVNFYKIGMELAYCDNGIIFAKNLISQGKNVFLDLKLLDVPNTVERATSRVVDIGAKFLTVHAYPSIMEAALRGSLGTNLEILGVTVLTSFDDNELSRSGYDRDVKELVSDRTFRAAFMGIHGVVCSALEVKELRNGLLSNMPNFKIITPGIRPAECFLDDQKRIATPSQAIKSGADYIVVGRPIIRARDPKEVALEIIAEIANAI